jgi:hypothetical protein
LDRLARHGRHDRIDGFAHAAGRANVADSASDISAVWLMAALASMLISIAYGSLIKVPAVILVNILCFAQCAYILFIKLQSERVSLAQRC